MRQQFPLPKGLAVSRQLQEPSQEGDSSLATALPSHRGLLAPLLKGSRGVLVAEKQDTKLLHWIFWVLSEVFGCCSVIKQHGLGCDHQPSSVPRASLGFPENAHSGLQKQSREGLHAPNMPLSHVLLCSALALGLYSLPCHSTGSRWGSEAFLIGLFEEGTVYFLSAFSPTLMYVQTHNGGEDVLVRLQKALDSYSWLMVDRFNSSTSENVTLPIADVGGETLSKNRGGIQKQLFRAVLQLWRR